MARRLSGAVIAVFLLGGGAPARATTFDVDRTDDTAAATACSGAPNDCPLRRAIALANTTIDIAGTPNVVQIPAGTYARTVATGLAVTAPVTIAGAGARSTILQGSATTRVLELAASGPVTLQDLTLSGGQAPLMNIPDGSVGGGLWAHGPGGNFTVTLRRVAVTGNRANGGLPAAPGAIDEPAHGAGIAVVAPASLVMEDSTVSGNIADVPGTKGTSSVGAGLYLTGIPPDVIRNSTIAGNEARGTGGHQGLGGGITSIGHPLNIFNSTIAGNSARDTGGNIDVGGPIALRNSVVAGGSSPTLPNCRPGGGAVTSTGGNVEDRNECNLGASDRRAVDPQLGPLQDNGGPTDTRAITEVSPAFDFAGACGLAADQRGVVRPQAAACDSGAFEALLGPVSQPVGPGNVSEAPAPAAAAPSTTCKLRPAGNTRGLRVVITCDRTEAVVLSGKAAVRARQSTNSAGRRRVRTKLIALAPVGLRVSGGVRATARLVVPRSLVAAVRRRARVSVSFTAKADKRVVGMASLPKLRAPRRQRNRVGGAASR